MNAQFSIEKSLGSLRYSEGHNKVVDFEIDIMSSGPDVVWFPKDFTWESDVPAWARASRRTIMNRLAALREQESFVFDEMTEQELAPRFSVELRDSLQKWSETQRIA